MNYTTGQKLLICCEGREQLYVYESMYMFEIKLKNCYYTANKLLETCWRLCKDLIVTCDLLSTKLATTLLECLQEQPTSA